MEWEDAVPSQETLGIGRMLPQWWSGATDCGLTLHQKSSNDLCSWAAVFFSSFHVEVIMSDNRNCSLHKLKYFILQRCYLLCVAFKNLRKKN